MKHPQPYGLSPVRSELKWPPQAFGQDPRRTGRRFAMIAFTTVLVVTLVAIAGYVLLPFSYAAPYASPTVLPPATAEDLLGHVDAALSSSRAAVEETARTQEWIDQALPGVAGAFLQLEKQRLETAKAAAESASRHAVEARQQLEVTKNLMIERNRTHGPF